LYVKCINNKHGCTLTKHCIAAETHT